MSEIRQIQVDGVNYDLVISEDEVSATAAAQSAAQAAQSATLAGQQATAASGYATQAEGYKETAKDYAEEAEEAADRAESVGVNGAILWAAAQSLTTANQQQAQANMGLIAFTTSELDTIFQ